MYKNERQQGSIMDRNRYRYRNFVYLAAAFLLLMAGICLDYEQAYSISAPYHTAVPRRAALSSSNNIISEEPCTAKLLGSGVVLEENAASGSSTGSRFRLERVSVSSSSVFMAFQPFFHSVCRRVQQKIHSHTVIMEYIHNKDGQKSRTVL